MSDLEEENNNPSEESQRQERLDDSRRRANSAESGSKAREAIKTAKNLAETATPVGAASLLKQINLLTDMPYVAAFGAALLKDLLDLVLAETIILPIIFSMMCGIFILMMLQLAGSDSGKTKRARRFAKSPMGKRILAIIAGTIAEMIPGLDFVPIESALVVFIYVLALIDRKKAQ